MDLKCDFCRTRENVRRTLIFDLCPMCEADVREEHKRYAAAHRRRQPLAQEEVS